MDMTLGQIRARIFYHEQSLITPVAHLMCAQQMPQKGKDLLRPHDLFPHLIEPPPRLKQIDPKKLPKQQRMMLRLQHQLDQKMITQAQFAEAIKRLEKHGPR